MERLPVGVVGVGHLGSLHARMYAELAGVDLIGVFDVDNDRAKSIAHELGARAFDSLNDLIENVQAASIVTPTSTHFEVAQRVIRAGRHVFLEKPMTATTAEAEELVSLTEEHGVKLQVGHIERFNPALLAIEKYAVNPMFVESHRLAQFNPRGTDVAVVLDLMIHDIDIILSLVRSPVVKIEANGVAVVSDTIDIANARLQFANGCVANVTASRISQKKMRKMRLFQRDAYISVDFSDGVAEVFRLVDGAYEISGAPMRLGEIDSGKTKRTIIYEQPEIQELNALKHELDLFVGAVRHDRIPAVTAQDGLQALQIAHDIIEKIRQQKLTV